MKFKDWEEFAGAINEYGRYGYVKKQSSYNPFTKVNSMVMEHKTRFDKVEFILYPDDESYDLDWTSDVYIPPQRSEPVNKPGIVFEPKLDRRQRENRSDNYPDKPGTTKDNTQPNPRPQTYRKRKGRRK